jgi:F420-dependent oxidoreductase-like protein
VTVRLSTIVNYAHGPQAITDQVIELERAGLDIAWVPEAYSFDAPSLMGYLAARTSTVEIGSGILPIYSRTPTLLAMTAAGIDALSDGRCILGLGTSGPQVIEGFHGVPYDRPVGRTREVIEICRKVWAREEPLVHDGPSYRIPVPADQGTGLGKPLRMINHPLRNRIPIWVAALGERNVSMTAEIADGWLPVFYIPEKVADVYGPSMAAGKAKRSPELGPLEIAAGGSMAFTEDPDEAARLRDVARPFTALYIGGMGARGRNFYNALVSRMGWEKEAATIQDLYLSGQKQEAAAAVPADLLEATTLIGSEGYIKDRIEAYRAVGVTVLNITPVGPNGTEDITRLKNLVS